MNDLLTRKKHSKRIAKLALKKGLIDKKFYEELYLESYFVQRRIKKKNRRGYRLSRYYKELCYCSYDFKGEHNECSGGCSGEYNEYSFIDYVRKSIFFIENDFNENGKTIKPVKQFNTNKKIIKYLSNMKIDKSPEDNS